MPEPEAVVPRASQKNVPRSGTDDLAQRLNERAVPEREGLPQHYRMRADAHYVDQLESLPQPVIRLLAIAQIDCADLPAADALDGLTKSILMHGVLQPLMVRKQGTRFSLIAGRKRLAAAGAGGLKTVPCLLHDVDEDAAAAIAVADNQRGDEATVPAAERTFLQPVLHAIASDLSTILTSTALLGNRGGGGLPQQMGAGLIETHASRAAWLASSLLSTFGRTRELPLGAIIQGVSDSFATHAALSGLELECTVTPNAAVRKLPEDATTAAITGAILATLSALEGIPRPRIELHADASPARALKIEVVQRTVRVVPDPGAPGEGDELMPVAELLPALALRLAKQVVAPHGGHAELTPLPGRGSVLQMIFPMVGSNT